MNHKPLFLVTVLIALLVISGVFWRIQNRPPMAVNQPVVTDPVVETPVQVEPQVEPGVSPDTYPQHIEAIPGNTDEVWYNIPELGIRMKLNREFAEDLVYGFEAAKGLSEKDGGRVYFSSKAVSNIAPSCAPNKGSMFGVFERLWGIGVDKQHLRGSLIGYHESDSSGQLIFQFPEDFILYTGPQDICWQPNLETEIRKVLPQKNDGLGAKTIREGFRFIEQAASK